MTTTHTCIPAPGWTLTADPVAQRVTLRGPGPEDYACAGPDAPDLNGRALHAFGQALAAAYEQADAVVYREFLSKFGGGYRYFDEYEGYPVGGFDASRHQRLYAAPQFAAAPAMHPRAILANIIAAMELDNGGPCPYGEAEYLEAMPYLLALREAGYFADSPNDLDGSFWYAAGAHDEEDADAFFAREIGAFVGLGPVLKRIFDGLAAAPEVAAPAEPRPYPPMPEFFGLWIAISAWSEAGVFEAGGKGEVVDERIKAMLRAYVDADRAAQAACTGRDAP